MTPTQTSCTIIREIPQNDQQHLYCLTSPKIGNLMTFVVTGYIAGNFSIYDPSESGSGSLNFTPTFQFSLRKVGG